MTRRNTVDLVNTADGPVIHWRCNCGHAGTLDRHGSHPDVVATGADTIVRDAPREFAVPIPA